MKEKDNSKRFLYLVQCEGYQMPYPDLCKSRDVLHLSWKVQNDKMIYFPDSTWTDGRNRLLEEARKLEKRYDYYIFLDDDIFFWQGGFKEFEDILLLNRPAIATPKLLGYPFNVELSESINPVFMFDACMNAFHHDLVFEDAIFPYYNTFDKISWWYSQYILIHLAVIFYRGHVIQFNDVHILNTQNRPYPRDMYLDREDAKAFQKEEQEKKGKKIDYFSSIEKWIYTTLLADAPEVLAVRELNKTRYIGETLPAKENYEISEKFKLSCFR